MSMTSQMMRQADEMVDLLKDVSNKLGIAIPAKINRQAVHARKINTDTNAVDDLFTTPRRDYGDFDSRFDPKELDADDIYDELRDFTPEQSLRDAVQPKPGEKFTDPLYGNHPDLADAKPQADHIFPFRNMIDLPGFRDLTPSQMREVINNPHNIWGLHPRVNGSKGSRLPHEWPGHSELGDLSRRARELLETESWMGEIAIQLHINRLLGG